MKDTEAALYWATKSWNIPEDVADKTGLPEAGCRTVSAEIKRVRKLHEESTEPLFQSLTGITRPLSRELTWIDGRTVDEAAFQKYTAWLKRAKVGEKFQRMQAVR